MSALTYHSLFLGVHTCHASFRLTVFCHCAWCGVMSCVKIGVTKDALWCGFCQLCIS